MGRNRKEETLVAEASSASVIADAISGRNGNIEIQAVLHFFPAHSLP